MVVISKITGKRLTYELVKKYECFNLYKVYDKDRYLYKTCEREVSKNV